MSSATTAAWSLAGIPDQSGRTAIVTGPSAGGIGYHVALELARRGALVVLAGRSRHKLEESRAAIRAEVRDPALNLLLVDLADLASVRAAATHAATVGPVHLLVNNAGVMGTSRQVTADGLDLQLATNHFGPFLLTGLLLPQLVESGAGRVVTVSSHLHRIARGAPLGDPRQDQRGRGGLYFTWNVYGQSKLANLLFTHELDRRARAAHLPVEAVAAHPGFAGTHLAANGQYGRSSGGAASILDAAIKRMSQPAAQGAWPVLMAATADLPGGSFVGPGGPAGMSGPPRLVGSTPLARDPATARQLWELSEQVTGLRWP